MKDLIHVPKMKDITRSGATEYKRIMKSDLLVIDDIMMFPVTGLDAVGFFNLVKGISKNTALI